MPTSWSTPPESRSTTRAPSSRSGPAARSATGRPVRNAHSPIWADASTSTRTPVAGCRIRPPAIRNRCSLLLRSAMTDVDYCVVGAGFAGLTAALRLKQAGRSVALLEARDRVGGRTYTEVLADGSWIDRGGAWIGPGQDRVYALMNEFGVPAYKQYVDGDAMMYVDGKKYRYTGTIPLSMSPWAVANIGAVFLELTQMCKSIPLEAPWEAPKAQKWDQLSWAAWLDRNTLSKPAHELLESAVAGLY